jgi:hypothetical protein
MGEAVDGSVASVKHCTPRHVRAPGRRDQQQNVVWSDPGDERGTADQGFPGDRRRLGSFDTRSGPRALQQFARIATLLVRDGHVDGGPQYGAAGPDMQAGGRLVMDLTMS